MPRRTPPERVVVSLYVNGNGASRAILELVSYISLQLCLVSLTEILWAWQAYRGDKRPGKKCCWLSTGRLRGAQASCSKLVVNFGNFCEDHQDANSSAGDSSSQENGAKDDAASVSGSDSDASNAGTTGAPACFDFHAKLYDTQRKAENKTKWEEVLCKCHDAFPALYEYARKEPGFDVRDEMFGELPEHVSKKRVCV